MQPLNLNRELVQKLLRVLHEHDDQCKESMVAAQYLAAVVGLLIGNSDRSPDEKQEIIKEINAFSLHVLNDFIERQPQPPAPPPADPSKAFGIWKPPGA